jgi:quercetin dioxygenase-like cupin family protein
MTTLNGAMSAGADGLGRRERPSAASAARSLKTMEHMETTRHLEDRVRAVSLSEAAAQAWAQAKESPARHSAITLIKRDALRVILIAMREGSELPGHRVEAGFTVQMLRGQVRFLVEGEERMLKRGDLFAVARGLPHDLVALEDSELLLTLGFPA